MLNSPAPVEDRDTAPSAEPVGAALLAGIATAIVLALWVGFYLFVFAPRSVP